MAAPRSFTNQLLRQLAARRRSALASALVVSLLGLAPATLARAQQAAPPPDAPAAAPNAPAAAPAAAPDKGVTHHEAHTFNRFLRRHPRIARAVRKDPSLVNNPDYLAKHKSLQKFLAGHPALQAQLKENPQAFMKQARHNHAHTNPAPTA